MRALGVLVGLSPAVFMRAGAQLVGNACKSSADQSFVYDKSTGTLSTLASGSKCLTAAVMPIIDGTSLVWSDCSASPAQGFTFIPSNNSIVASSDQTKCLNLAGYGTDPGTQIWLYTCSSADCEGNCDWKQTPGPDATLQIQNPESGLCMDDGLGPPPPHTCAPGSPSVGLPFCNYNLTFEQRVADLMSRLTQDYKVKLFSNPIQPAPYNATLNLKTFYWDITCIHGLSPGILSPNPNVTVFPHAIAQAATWDIDLVNRISSATALEGRVVNQINYRETSGTTYQGVHCDGGPLANSIHDPRWGRTSETYGEDPTLAAVIGTVATLALQNRTAPGFMQTAQVTRHYLGYHQATDLPTAEEYINSQWLEDQQLPIYGAFQSVGLAEGIMCAIAAVSSSAWNGSMIPSCVNNFLLTEKLRDEWNSTCFIQSDCCDSISAMVDPHHYYPNLTLAVAGAINAGLSASYGNAGPITAALQDALSLGLVSQSLFETRISRNLLTRFRLGEFDTENPQNAFRGPYDESILDGPVNRALAREAMAKSVVLLENRAGVLPFTFTGKQATFAVVGPLANCTQTGGGYGGYDNDSPLQCSYLHSYNGQASSVSTIVDALAEEIAGTGNTLAYSQGTNIVSAYSGSGIADAAALAAVSDYTVVVVGLTALIEAESNDRTYLGLPPIQQELLQAVSEAAGPDRVILVIVSANAVDFDPALASTVLQAWYGGEETGHGLMDVVTGRVPPSGRMPLTTYQEPYLSFVNPISDFNMISNGTGRTYRYYSGPLLNYRFGYGLRYASVNYSDASVAVNADGSVDVTVFAANTGGVDTDEIVQLYVSVPTVPGLATPMYGLQAFAKVHLPAPSAPARAPRLYSEMAGVHARVRAAPAETRVGAGVMLDFTLARSQFTTVLANGSRTVTPGQYAVHVGGHLPGDVKADAQSNVLTVEFSYA